MIQEITDSALGRVQQRDFFNSEKHVHANPCTSAPGSAQGTEQKQIQDTQTTVMVRGKEPESKGVTRNTAAHLNVPPKGPGDGESVLRCVHWGQPRYAPWSCACCIQCHQSFLWWSSCTCVCSRPNHVPVVWGCEWLFWFTAVPVGAYVTVGSGVVKW
jgi:hypothetical protein